MILHLFSVIEIILFIEMYQRNTKNNITIMKCTTTSLFCLIFYDKRSDRWLFVSFNPKAGGNPPFIDKITNCIVSK
jgi:hypothetical protein